MVKTKYMFITGGVLSSLGKGIAAASIGNILESYGFNITIIKLDPYLNVDPGTMSPFQHGEVYVTDDGAETDLDLGHYERFTSTVTSQKNNCTAGKIYDNVIQKERKGDYLGKTVQVIPHVTDEIKSVVTEMSGKFDIIIVEIGGTVGDIESLPFLEAIRQIGLDSEPGDVLFIHLTLVPNIKTAGELKTKPTQHSVKALREIGIQPDLLLCRAEIPLPTEIKKKIALFTNLRYEDIVSAYDVENIYEIPLIFKEQGLGESILRKLHLEKKQNDSHEWIKWVDRSKKIKEKVIISIVGKYVKLGDSYKSLFEALYHGGVANDAEVELDLVESDNLLEWNLDETFRNSNGILVPGGFGIRGIEGMIKAVEYARVNRIPYFGICLGMQTASVEFLRHVAGIKNAHSAEFSKSSSNMVFLKLKELINIEEMGHNMRLGTFSCILKKGSLSYRAYNKDKIFERHRHRYEFNPEFESVIEEKGMIISGKNAERNLVEMIELKDHPWFIGCQFHPEFKSKPLQPHPLFVSFIRSAIENKAKRNA
ncbi:MAG: CTP synthase [Candidatus Aminicenantes bacterium]|nr:CTP synthase [Candidatus Aminicenantes bacterium]